MPRTPAKALRKNVEPSLENEVRAAITWLKRHSTRRTLEGMARYGIPSDNAFGVSVADIRALAKKLGRNHLLAAALWKTGCYEARMLACFVDEPERVTTGQMDRWCRGFDSWAICDTVFSPVRSDAIRVGESTSVVDFTKRIRQTGRLRINGFPRCARQSCSRHAVSGFAASHRAGRARRTQFREEGRELGHARNRQALFSAQRRRRGGSQASGVVERNGVPMGRQRCTARVG
jgi:DNA alkylation repair enzyme